MMTFEDVKKEVETYRQEYGNDICSDAYIDGDDDDVAGYVFMPNDITGYTQEYHLPTGRERHCGNGRGCFWTDWN